MAQTRHEIRERRLPITKILVVGVVVLSLIGVVIYELNGRIQESMVTRAHLQAVEISKALDAYRVDHGGYPGSLEELLESDEKGRPPYLNTRDELLDPWGRMYQYDPNGSRSIASAVVLEADVYTEVPDGSGRLVGNFATR